ncbi:MAG: hypothetical protein IJY92_00445 [Alphaproteobacteria bacterium]|nr:hypothetical protein [Alphaproteobacteria bacterium]
MNKEELKKYLELGEPIFTEKYAPKLAPYAKIIYLIGLVILAISLLGAVVTLFSNFAAAILTVIAVVVEFVLFRMFCEFLQSHGK